MASKDQAYFWTHDWQTAEHEADEDIFSGRVYGFETVELAIAHLRESRSELIEEQPHHDLS